MEDMSMNTNEIMEINHEVDETSDSSCGAIVAGFAGGMVAYFVMKGASKAWAWTKRMVAKGKLMKRAA